MSHPLPGSFPQQQPSSFPGSSPLPQHAHNGAYYAAAAAPQPAPVLSAPGSLAPSTSSSSTSSTHSIMQQLQSQQLQQQQQQQQQHPGQSPMQPMWNHNQQYAAPSYPNQQSSPPHHQPTQQPQQQQPYPLLHSQASLPAAGRLTSHESSAPSAYLQPQQATTTMSAPPAYSPVNFMATQQQQQQQPQSAQHARSHSMSSPTPSAHLPQPHPQQQPQQQQQTPHQIPQPQQQQQQQQQSHLLQQPNQPPNMLYNQLNIQQQQQQHQQQHHHPNQPFTSQQPHPIAASYPQSSATPFSPIRMQQQPQQPLQQQYQPHPQQPQQQQLQQLQHPMPHDRQSSSGPAAASPHGQQPQPSQHQQPPSSPRHPAAQFMGNYPPAGGQMGSVHAMGMMQQQQQHLPAQPQSAPFYANQITAPTTSPTLLAPGQQPVGVPLVNYGQPMPVSMAASNMPSAVVMASTASAPSNYTAVHHNRNKAARHHPLASAAAAVAAESKATASESEGSSDSTPIGSPGGKPLSSPPRSKFPRPSASSHPPFQLLKTESKRPYATLLYTANKRMLPSFLAKKQALFGQEQPPPPADSPDSVTIKVRLMALNNVPPPALPPLSSLYFVAADISAIIHSRKSNIAKAVSSFPDDEKKRASVLCAQQNGTVSTHSLTVLSWKGVERLLNFSCAPVALPFLDWLRGEVHKLSAVDTPASMSLSGSSAGYGDKEEGGEDKANGASPADTTASPSAAESSEDEKLLSPNSTSPDLPQLKAEQQQQQQSPHQQQAVA